jgi:hypothetical protein
MTIREKLQDKKIGTPIAAGMALFAVLLATYVLWPARKLISDPYTTYYSDDDGQTYFKDSIYKLAPFDHDGKTASIAVVIDDGNHVFVGYLERYTPDAKKQIQAALDANPQTPYKVLELMGSPAILYGGMEAKLPGSNNSWVSRSKVPIPRMQLPEDAVIKVVHP